MTSATVSQSNAFWDAGAGVWVATSRDIPGLATEAKACDQLQRKLQTLIPDLLMFTQAIAADYKASIVDPIITQFL